MDLRTLSFTKVEGLYLSDAITSNGKEIVVYIQLKKLGNLRMERSINGVDWAVADNGVFTFDEKEIQISGAIEGQQLRFVSKEPVVKSHYHV